MAPAIATKVGLTWNLPSRFIQLTFLVFFYSFRMTIFTYDVDLDFASSDVLGQINIS